MTLLESLNKLVTQGRVVTAAIDSDNTKAAIVALLALNLDLLQLRHTVELSDSLTETEV